MKINCIHIFLFIILATFISCKKDDDKPTEPQLTTNGVFIVNEGAFGAGNGSISFLNLLSNEIFNDVFENKNGFPLGDLAQSMTIHQSKAYLLVNGSQKIEVVDALTFNSLATISGFDGPRYMVSRGSKGYVSDWFSNAIKVVDLNTNAVVKSIPTGSGPEQMLLVGNQLFVTNVGGWGSDSTVTVINTDTETATSTLQVGLNPNSIKIDNNGKIWILCNGSTGPDYTGGTADDIAGSLWKFNPLSLTMELQMNMNSFDHPSKLQTNSTGNLLFYLNGTDGYNGRVVSMNSNATSISPTPVTGKEFYGLGVDPVSGAIYGGYSPGFSQNGYIFRFSPSMILVDSMEVGIGPNQFVFQ